MLGRSEQRAASRGFLVVLMIVSVAALCSHGEDSSRVVEFNGFMVEPLGEAIVEIREGRLHVQGLSPGSKFGIRVDLGGCSEFHWEMETQRSAELIPIGSRFDFEMVDERGNRHGVRRTRKGEPEEMVIWEYATLSDAESLVVHIDVETTTRQNLCEFELPLQHEGADPYGVFLQYRAIGKVEYMTIDGHYSWYGDGFITCLTRKSGKVEVIEFTDCYGNFLYSAIFTDYYTHSSEERIALWTCLINMLSPPPDEEVRPDYAEITASSPAASGGADIEPISSFVITNLSGK